MRMSFSERTQVLLSPELKRKVELLASRSFTSVGAVIREAIAAYLPPASADRRRQALEELFSLDAPVDDWPVMEREIEDGYLS